MVRQYFTGTCVVGHNPPGSAWWEAVRIGKERICMFVARDLDFELHLGAYQGTSE